MQIDENPMRIDGNQWKSIKTEGGGGKNQHFVWIQTGKNPKNLAPGEQIR